MKKKFMMFLFLLALTNSFAQDIAKMNSNLKLSDSLTFETEIRIYQNDAITNYSSLLRIFEDDSKKWTAEFYEHYDAVSSSGTKLRTTQRIIKPKRDFDFIKASLERSEILHLPSFDKIRWKFKVRGEIEKIIEYSKKGRKNIYYSYMNEVGGSMDGESFIIQAKIVGKTNEFSFSNPDLYLKKYPKVDELNYAHEIMELIRNEFQIWGKE